MDKMNERDFESSNPNTSLFRFVVSYHLILFLSRYRFKHLTFLHINITNHHDTTVMA